MHIGEIARLTGSRLVVSPQRGRGEVARLFASNTMSDLIANAGHDTLVLTSLNNSQLVRVAELMDIPGICLAGGAAPSAELVESARASGTALLVTTESFETALSRLRAALR